MKEEIIGGLKIALSKGQSLQDAMQSFYNAGYKKEEIEESARALRDEQTQIQYPPFVQSSGQTQIIAQQPTSLPQQTLSQKEIQQIPKPAISVSYNQQQKPVAQFSQKPIQLMELKPTSPLPSPPKPPPKQQESGSYIPLAHLTKQVVSNYDIKPEKKFDALTIMLIVILVLLIGVLAAVFIFKDQLVEFLNKFLD